MLKIKCAIEAQFEVEPIEGSTEEAIKDQAAQHFAEQLKQMKLSQLVPAVSVTITEVIHCCP